MRLTTSLLVLPLFVSLGPVSAADTVLEPGYELVTRGVKYTDLDLTDNAAVSILYERIKTAAAQVCDPVDSKLLETLQHVRRCEGHAVGQAVRDVNAPKLTGLHLKATHQMEFTLAR